MKKKILSMLLAVVMLVSVLPMSAMTASATINTDKYEPLHVASGFNVDSIAEAYPVYGVNVWNYYLANPTKNHLNATFATQSAIKSFSDTNYSKNYLNGFPDNGLVECISTSYPGLYWQMAPYDEKNTLCLKNEAGLGIEGTLTFNNIGTYKQLFVMAAAVGIEGSSSTMGVTVNYTDGTSSTTNFTVYDHYLTPTNQRACQDVLYSFKYASGHTTSICPVTVSTSKLIKSVTIKNTDKKTGAGFVIFAITGEVAEIEAPTINIATNTACTSFTANWDAVANASGYRLDVATDENFSNMVDGYNNKVVNATSCSITGLTPGQKYYYRVRSVDKNGFQGKSSGVVSNTLPNHNWLPATVDAPETCNVCGATRGEKLPSIHASYVDPVTGETVELGEATNDDVAEVVDSLLSKPMQVPNNIFLGWYTDKGALNKHTTRFDTFTNVTASFAGITPMAKDPTDEKMVDDYLSFELVGAQIRRENTIEDDESATTDKEVYGGLRYISSFEEDLYNTIGKSNVIEYGILLASKDNAKLFADHYGVPYDKYEIQYNNGVNGGTADTDFRYVTNVVCSGLEDHRTFDNYRLFTAVIDYEGAEGLKGTEFVARSYIKYRDANGVERIFYGDYRGTKVFGGCSVSYNQALTM